MTAEWCCPNDWACHNHVEHQAPAGCVHHASWLADRHDRERDGDDQ